MDLKWYCCRLCKYQSLQWHDTWWWGEKKYKAAKTDLWHFQPKFNWQTSCHCFWAPRRAGQDWTWTQIQEEEDSHWGWTNDWGWWGICVHFDHLVLAEKSEPKSWDILICVCRQKDAKWCCSISKLDCPWWVCLRFVILNMCSRYTLRHNFCGN